MVGSAMCRDSWQGPVWVALWAVGLAAGAAVLVLVLSDPELAGHRVAEVLSVLAAWSFLASGLIALRRRPGSLPGVLMVVAGAMWLTGGLMLFSDWPVVFTAGIVLNDAWAVPFVALLVSLPAGRLRTRRDLLFVAPFAVAVIPLEIAWLLFLETGPPGNALLVSNDPGVADAIDTAQLTLLTGGALALVAVLVGRFRAASAPLRRSLTPILAGALVLLLVPARLSVEKITDSTAPEALTIATVLAFIAVPIAVLADMLRARLARAAVGELVLALRSDPAPGALRDALARALGDPSLVVAPWLPEFETYADLDGKPLTLPADLRRVTTLVDRNGTPVAALVHDPSLSDEPELLDAVGATAAIAVENARLEAELLARVDELRATGTRILEAAQGERRRLERDLHDGAQQRLVALNLELSMLESRLRDDPETRSAVAQARGELAQSLGELRELARGLHPAVLTGYGLPVALDSLAARAPVPVRVDVALDGRLPEPVEVAAYFLVSEALTNVAKYAHASTASVEVSQANGGVVVEIADDGIGGATMGGGSGLRGLADRVEALGGRLRVDSPAGEGTRMRAEIPCA
jgi:signal transduction histidine kinase